MEPSYITSHKNGRLKKASAAARSLLESCEICPRRCKVNRLKDKRGYCRTGRHSVVYSYMAHRGEEPPLSGSRGSGTIFFSNCNMSCVYCQNFDFSQKGAGKEISASDLAGIMLSLQEEGVHNINFVTPTHVMPQILEALEIAVMQGLRVPLVYNTGGYELAEMIEVLGGIVDIFLPDMRYADEKHARRYSDAPDYPLYNRAAVRVMHRQAGAAVFDDDGIMSRGLIIRHLVLPGGLAGTGDIMKFIARKLSPETYITLMSQYSPYFKALQTAGVARRITESEYEDAQKIMADYGLGNGWVQESGGIEKLAGAHITPREPEGDA